MLRACRRLGQPDRFGQCRRRDPAVHAIRADSVLTAVAVFATLGRVSAHDHQSVERVSPLIAADRE